MFSKYRFPVWSVRDRMLKIIYCVADNIRTHSMKLTQVGYSSPEKDFLIKGVFVFRFYLFYVCRHFTFMCIYAPCVCVVFVEARRGFCSSRTGVTDICVVM